MTTAYLSKHAPTIIRHAQSVYSSRATEAEFQANTRFEYILIVTMYKPLNAVVQATQPRWNQISLADACMREMPISNRERIKEILQDRPPSCFVVAYRVIHRYEDLDAVDFRVAYRVHTFQWPRQPYPLFTNAQLRATIRGDELALQNEAELLAEMDRMMLENENDMM